MPKINLGGIVLLSPLRYYYLYLSIALLLLYLAERIRTSRVGLAIFALKSNETAALTIGVAPRYYFTLAMALSGFYAGIGGVMFAFLVGFLGSGVIRPPVGVILHRHRRARRNGQ